MPHETRAQLWKGVFDDLRRLDRCSQEHDIKIMLVADWFDKHLGKEWRSQENIEAGQEFEIAIQMMDEKLNSE